MENNQNMVEIKNTSGGKLLLVYHNQYGYVMRRSMAKRGSILIPMEDIRYALTSPGVSAAFQAGLLKIVDPELAKQLESITIVSANRNTKARVESTAVLDEDQIAGLFEGKNNGEIFKAMRDAPENTRDLIINYMVENQIFDNIYVGWVKELWDYDMLPAIEVQRQMQEKAPGEE